MVDDQTYGEHFILRIILEPLIPQEWDEDEYPPLFETYFKDLQMKTDLYHNKLEIKSVLVRGLSPIERLKAVITIEYHSIDIIEPKSFIYNQLPFVINHTMHYFEIDDLPMEIVVDKSPSAHIWQNTTNID